MLTTGQKDAPGLISPSSRARGGQGARSRSLLSSSRTCIWLLPSIADLARKRTFLAAAARRRRNSLSHICWTASAAMPSWRSPCCLNWLWIRRGSAREVRLGFLHHHKLWNPVTDQFGAYPFIYGHVVTSVLALADLRPAGCWCGDLIFRNWPLAKRRDIADLSWWSCWPPCRASFMDCSRYSR